jgi:cytochrome c-type protein NapC
MPPSAFSDQNPRGSRWRFGLPALLAAMIVGALLTWGGSEVVAWTNTEAFCITCHEMRDNVYAEYQDTIHDQNRTGVRAICADCHVPRETVPKMIRKVKATFELYGHFTGKIDTPEKFETHRYDMAKKVWTEMRADDSRSCRSCHEESAMSPYLASERAQERHKEGVDQGLTCIDCHFGIAHTEPEGELTPQELGVTIQK